MSYRTFERIRNWLMLCGATLVGYDMLKYVAYVGSSLEEEVLRFVGWLFICVIAGLGGVFSLGSAKQGVFDIRIFREPFARRAVIVEGVAAAYMCYLTWMAVRFGEMPRVIGFAMLFVVLGIDTVVRLLMSRK